ncbi:MAG: response regulator [Candidatus Omnitrophota bacterium]
MAKKILVIDDSEQLVQLVEMRLKASGYDVIKAYEAQKGIDLARQVKPDLIIPDVVFPKMDGYEVCKILKSDSKLGNVPIIMLSGMNKIIDVKLARLAGADAYCTKPFIAETLLARIKELLNQ